MPQTFKLSDAVLFDGEQQAWRTHADASAYRNPIPSMMAHDEFVFLRWAAERFTEPQDRILDMGPLAGGSTLALATGVCRSAAVSRRKIIHTYDLWEFWPGFDSFFPGHQLKDGDDSFPLFWKNIEEVQDLVEPHRGDIGDMDWNREQIGILFLDAAKTPKVMAQVVNKFLPSLRISGLFVQQDYVSSQHPWIHVAHELLMDHFIVADSPFGGTVCFKCTDPVPSKHLADHYFASMAPGKVTRLLRRAAARVRGWERLCIELSEAYYWLMRGTFSEASRILDHVVSSADYHEYCQPDVDIIYHYLSKKNRPHPEYLAEVHDTA